MNDRHNLAGVFCLWEYKPEKSPRERVWNFVASIPVGLDGYAFEENPYQLDRSAYGRWVNQKVWWDPRKNQAVTECPPGVDEDDYHWDEIFGRVVTVWTVENGVALRHFSPPENYPWLPIDYGRKIRVLPNWWEFIQDGALLLGRTTRVVQDLLYGKEEDNGSD